MSYLSEVAYRNAYGVLRAVFDETYKVIQSLDPGRRRYPPPLAPGQSVGAQDACPLGSGSKRVLT